MRQSTLPFLSQVQAKRRVEDYEKKPYDTFMYPNPKSAKTKFFNEVTPTLFESFGKHLPKEQCKTYIRKERQSRLERFENFKTMNHRFQAMFNPEYTGGFYKFLEKPTLPRQLHIDHCERGMQNIDQLTSDIEKHESKVKESLRKCFINTTPRKHMEEQVSHYTSYLQDLRDLKEKLQINKKNLEDTLGHLRKIFKIKVMSRFKSDQSRRRKEGRYKARTDKLRRAQASAASIGRQARGEALH